MARKYTGQPADQLADEGFLQVVDVARRVKGRVKQSQLNIKLLSAAEKKQVELLQSVVGGDRARIEELLDENPELDVYTEDMAGRTPLHLAVDAGSMEIVGSILERYNKDDQTDRILIKSVLMGAISRDQELVSETIVQQARYDALFPPLDNGEAVPSAKRRKSLITTTGPLTGDIFQNIDPIVLASQRNHFGLVQILLNRGDYIQNPHEPSCQCLICKEMFSKDQLMAAKLRLEIYRGLSSDAYVSLAAEDPIATAFSLGKELRQMASIEKHYKNEYLQLANNLSEYVYKLMDEVKTDKELRWILNKEESTGFNEQLPRIKLAVENGEKHFVAHPSCQQKLTEIWYQDLRNLSNSTWLLRLIGLVYLLFSPFIWLVYLFSPKRKLGRFIRIPFMRFLGSIVWFILFLTTIVTLAYESYLVNRWDKRYAHLADNRSSPLNQFFAFRSFPSDKGARGESTERILLASFVLWWVVGMLWTEVKKIYRLGHVNYCSDLFNILESLVIIMYLMAIGLMFDTERNLVEKQRFVIEEWSFNTMFDASSVYQDLAREYWYWVIPDRHYWESADPSLVADALLAAASVFAISKVFYYMAASSVLGPLQIGFRRILRDVLKFFVFLFLLFMAFMIALQTLFQPYTVENRRDTEVLAPDADNPVSATKNFGGISNCLRSMFFALFALGEYTAVDITDGSNPYTHHTFTQGVASIIYAAFHFTMIVVMLNFFVAIMNETFEEVMKSNDREWKFARAKLYLDFLTSGTQPSPLNLLPSFKAWFYFLTCRYTKERYVPSTCCGSMCGDPGKNKIQPVDDKETGVEEIKPKKGGILADAGSATNMTYQDVIYNLVKRFLQRKQVEIDSETSGVEEMKKDIVALRQQIEARIVDHKKMVKAAGDVTNTQNVSLTTFDKRLSKAELGLGRMIETLQKFIKMLQRFKDVKDEMAKSQLESTLTSELMKSRKKYEFLVKPQPSKIEKEKTFVAGGTWSAASLAKPGDRPKTSKTLERSSNSKPSERKSSSWKVQSARRTTISSISDSMDGSSRASSGPSTAQAEGLQQSQAEVETQAVDDGNTPEEDPDSGMQQMTKADTLDHTTDNMAASALVKSLAQLSMGLHDSTSNEPPGARSFLPGDSQSDVDVLGDCETPEVEPDSGMQQKTKDTTDNMAASALAKSLTQLYTGLHDSASISNEPSGARPFLPGDSQSDVDIFLATQQAKGTSDDEELPDYTLPGDL